MAKVVSKLVDAYPAAGKLKFIHEQIVFQSSRQ